VCRTTEAGGSIEKIIELVTLLPTRTVGLSVSSENKKTVPLVIATMRASFENELFKKLDKLTQEQQEKAIAYIQALLNQETNKQGLVALAGSIDPASIEEMTKAIEAGCENIDSHKW
jgi:GTP-binding protein EngB required for normal cell division